MATTHDWLDAEQAVMPDGTEHTNLALAHPKLPSLSIESTVETMQCTHLNGCTLCNWCGFALKA